MAFPYQNVMDSDLGSTQIKTDQLTGAQKFHIASGLLSAGTNLTASFAHASAIRSHRKFMGQQLMYQSELADFAASDAIRRGDKEAGRLSQRVAKLIGSQRAALAAQGIAGSDDAKDIVRETAEVGAEDVRTIRNNAFREAFGYRNQSVQLKSQARFERIAGKNKERQEIASGFGRAGSSLIVSAGQAGGYF